MRSGMQCAHFVRSVTENFPRGFHGTNATAHLRGGQMGGVHVCVHVYLHARSALGQGTVTGNRILLAI